MQPSIVSEGTNFNFFNSSLVSFETLMLVMFLYMYFFIGFIVIYGNMHNYINLLVLKNIGIKYTKWRSKMAKNIWKTIAIIFIVLFALSTSFYAYTYVIGTNYIRNEDFCSINVCGNGEFDKYWYEHSERMCYCLNNEGDILYQEIIK